jgi:hypothetical protein
MAFLGDWGKVFEGFASPYGDWRVVSNAAERIIVEKMGK